MKNIALFLFVIFLNSCSQVEKCNLNFEQFLNTGFLKSWNQRTEVSLKEIGDEKSTFILSFEKKYNVSIFDRSNFMRTSNAIHKYSNANFGELLLLEMNYSGEKNQRVKYLIGICDKESNVFKCVQGVHGWTFSNVYKINTKKIEHLYQVLNEKKGREYWGHNITEIACLTKIKGANNINVQVFGSLNKLQYDAINELNFKD